MASDDASNPLAESDLTMHSDSEQYSAGEEALTSPPSSGSPVILYKPPTMWSMIRGAAINLLLPFINGMMLGFGELFAHEAAFRLGWGGTKVRAHKAPVLLSDARLVPTRRSGKHIEHLPDTLYRSSPLADDEHTPLDLELKSRSACPGPGRQSMTSQAWSDSERGAHPHYFELWFPGLSKQCIHTASLKYYS
jgi:hypothetical protein